MIHIYLVFIIWAALISAIYHHKLISRALLSLRCNLFHLCYGVSKFGQQIRGMFANLLLFEIKLTIIRFLRNIEFVFLQFVEIYFGLRHYADWLLVKDFREPICDGVFFWNHLSLAKMNFCLGSSFSNRFILFLYFNMVLLRLGLPLFLVKNIEETPVCDVFVDIKSNFLLILWFQS